MNPVDTSYLVARFVVGDAAPEELVEWAIACMQDGLESRTLPIVAGYTKVELSNDTGDFRNDVTRLFKEFEISLPSMNAAREWFARYLCEGIIGDSLCPDSAHFELYELWRESNYQPELEYQPRLEPFMYLSDSLGLVEMGEVPVVNGLTSENYHDFLKKECRIYLEAEKPMLGEQAVPPKSDRAGG